MSEKNSYAFEAQTKQLLDLMIHSIYTHKEIFLRELLSNASDAIDKVRFNAITEPDKYKNVDNLGIDLVIDEATRTLTISDNGIGMTEEEVKRNIGTIASSGTKAFLEQMNKQKQSDSNVELIGQFGVGFYSAFMVADNIIVETKSEDSDTGIRFESSADGSYTLEHIEKSERGTSIILKLKPASDEGDEGDENNENYADRYTLQHLVKKYSDYVRFPIRMDMPKEVEPEYDADGKIVEKADEPIQYESTTLNSMVSIWQKNKNDVSHEEYCHFYREHFHEYDEPVEIIHTKVEGTVEYKALLFIPKRPAFNFHQETFEKGLDLYSKNVFIMSKCKELVPDYLRFVKGLVDSPDFSLNISREILQHTGDLKKIANNIEKKIIDTFRQMLKNDREKYEGFFKEFGESIKMGIYQDMGLKDKLTNLILFQTNTSEGKYSTFAEYKERMKDDQEFIYYATGESIAQIEGLPHMEFAKSKGYEVLYFTDRIDEFMTGNIREFEGKQIRSISQAETKPADESKKDEPIDESVKSVLTAMKEALGDKVFDVTESDKLVESVVCFVSKEGGMTFNMAKVLSETGNNMFGMKAEKILEVNTKHPLFEKIKNEYNSNKDSDEFKEYSQLLYDDACIEMGMPIEEPKLFSKRLSKLMMK